MRPMWKLRAKNRWKALVPLALSDLVHEVIYFCFALFSCVFCKWLMFGWQVNIYRFCILVFLLSPSVFILYYQGTNMFFTRFYLLVLPAAFSIPLSCTLRPTECATVDYNVFVSSKWEWSNSYKYSTWNVISWVHLNRFVN